MRNILEAFLNKQFHAGCGTEEQNLKPQKQLPLQKIKTGGVLLQRNTPPNPCVCKETDHRIIILCAFLPCKK